MFIHLLSLYNTKFSPFPKLWDSLLCHSVIPNIPKFPFLIHPFQKFFHSSISFFLNYHSSLLRSKISHSHHSKVPSCILKSLLFPLSSLLFRILFSLLTFLYLFRSYYSSNYSHSFSNSPAI